MDFQKTLISWYSENKRDLPWRASTDPYVIWLSEIILQQTRVDQGMPYFQRFLETFPGVKDFASAEEANVLKLWQGLGYYSRARNMLSTAKQVVSEHNGRFPSSYKALLQLKGIGPYSAAAISSFSVGEPQAVLDGNVYRVLARYFGIDTPINSSSGIKEFSQLARKMLFLPDPALYNQAIMEFGALQCKPRKPNCEVCPFRLNCFALNHNKVDVLPVKLPKAAKKTRFFNYFIFMENDKVLVRQRQAGDIWQHLYDFPSIETPAMAELDSVEFIELVNKTFGDEPVLTKLVEMKHILTHQLIKAQFFRVDDFLLESLTTTNCKWVTIENLDHLPQPKLIHNFVEKFILAE